MNNRDCGGSSTVLGRELFQDESLWLLYLYWRQLPRTCAYPSRRSIDPTEIPSSVLSYVFMIDVEWQDEEPSFIYRLVGTGIINHYSINFAGQTPRTAFPHWFQDLEAAYGETAKSGAPAIARYRAPLEDKGYKLVERLLCPCSEQGERVDLLFGALSFSSVTEASGYS